MSAYFESFIGGGVIRRARGRFRTAIVDDPTSSSSSSLAPLSTSESVGTTSSSLSSTKPKKVKRKFNDRFGCDVITKSIDEASIERGKSLDLRTVRRSKGALQQPRNTPTVTDVSSIELHEGNPQPKIELQQPAEEPNIEIGAIKQPTEEPNIEIQQSAEEPNIEIEEETNIEIGATQQLAEETNIEIGATQQPAAVPISEMFAELSFSEKDAKQKSHDENIELETDYQKL